MRAIAEELNYRRNGVSIEWGIRGVELERTERGIILIDDNAENIRAIEAVMPYHHPLKIVAAARSIEEAQKYIFDCDPYGIVVNCVVRGQVVTEFIDGLVNCKNRPVVIAYAALYTTILRGMCDGFSDGIYLINQKEGFSSVLGAFFTFDWDQRSGGTLSQLRQLRKTDIQFAFHFWELNKKGAKKELTFDQTLARYMGYRIRSFRIQREITDTQVYAQLSPRTYTLIENGTINYISAPKWKALETALGAKADVILGMSEYDLYERMQLQPWTFLEEYNKEAPRFYSPSKRLVLLTQ